MSDIFATSRSPLLQSVPDTVKGSKRGSRCVRIGPADYRGGTNVDDKKGCGCAKKEEKKEEKKGCGCGKK